MRRINIHHGKDVDGGFTARVIGRDEQHGPDCRADRVGRRGVHRDDDPREERPGTCFGCHIGWQ